MHRYRREFGDPIHRLTYDSRSMLEDAYAYMAKE